MNVYVYIPVGCGIPDRAQNMVPMMNKSNICGQLDCGHMVSRHSVPAHVVGRSPTLVYGPKALQETTQNFI
jgi:hypothetical protein